MGYSFQFCVHCEKKDIIIYFQRSYSNMARTRYDQMISGITQHGARIKSSTQSRIREWGSAQSFSIYNTFSVITEAGCIKSQIGDTRVPAPSEKSRLLE